jgi:glycosyltransferase involved in cell wall biosynthesis
MVRLFAQLSRHDPTLFFLVLAPQGDHARTRELSRAHGLAEQHLCLAELPHPQVAAALRQVHAGLLLRRSHPVNQVSSPTKFGEYLAAGVPVIMTEGIGDFGRMAAEQGVGLVLKAGLLDLDPFPEAEVARIAQFVRESQQEGNCMARRCRTAARRYLHWDAAWPELHRGYRQAAERGQDLPAHTGPPVERGAGGP